MHNTTGGKSKVAHAPVSLILILGLLMAIGPLATDAYLPAFPAIVDDLRTTESQVQATLAGSLLGLGLGQLVTGPLSDALGRKMPVLTGMGALVLLSVGCALVTDVRLLVVLRVLQGLAGAAGVVAATAVVRDLYTGHAAAVVRSRLVLVMGLAPVFAPTLGSLVLGWSNWRGIFYFLAAVGVVILVCAAIWLPETHPRERRLELHPAVTMRGYWKVLKDPVVMLMVLVTGAGSASLFAYIAGSSFVLQGFYGLSPQVYALVFGGLGLSMIVLGQLNPPLLVRFGLVRSQVILLGFSLLSVLVMVALVATGIGGVWGFVLPLIGIVGVVSAQGANTTTVAMHRHPELAGTIAALLGAARFAIGGVMAPIVGLVAGSQPLPLALILTVTTLVGFLATVFSRRQVDAYLLSEG